MADAYPLAWPEGWSRTPATNRKRAPYKTEPARAVQHLRDELRRIGAVGAYVKDGSPIADARNPDDPGVSVYWSTTAFKDRVIACDKWLKVYDNIHAIGLAIEHLRGMDRCGATQVVDRAFTAFGALPAAAAAPVTRPWWEVLDIPQNAIGALSVAMVQARYRELAAKRHPDRTGSAAAMLELGHALEEAKRHYGGG
jgi:hypothetical protein